MKKEISKKILQSIKNAFIGFKVNYKQGLNTEELFCFFKSTLDKELGEYQLVYDYIWGKDSVNIDGITKGYIPREGDTVIMDISVNYKGVWCDVCRTYFVGKASKEQVSTFELIKDSITAGEKVLAKGVSASSVYNAVNSVYLAQGKNLVHHAGHKIEGEPIAKPQFLPDEDGVIESNAVYAIESGLYNGFGIRLENDYFVTDDSVENLFIELMPLDVKEYELK